MGEGSDAAPLGQAARKLALALFGEDTPRWHHTVGVVGRAEELAVTVSPADRDLLLAAAWLHDVGYVEQAAVTGFHPLDGALFLERNGWPIRLCALVAHHSGADIVAEERALGDAVRDFHDERSPLSDALTYADQTIGVRGERLTVEERMQDMLRRHGPDSPSARAHRLRGPFLLAIADRVERRLRQL